MAFTPMINLPRIRFSIVTVCYNSERTIRKTLQSVCAQVGVDVEHIIVDGGSTDRTLAIVSAEKIKCGAVISERDKGMYDAMNKGIALSTGDYILFLNSDDSLADGLVLKEVADAIGQGGAPDLVYGNVSIIDVNGLYKSTWGRRHSLLDFYRRTQPPHQACFYKAASLRGGECYRYVSFPCCADTELTYRFFKNHRCAYFNRVIAIYSNAGRSSKVRFICCSECERWRFLASGASLLTLTQMGWFSSVFMAKTLLRKLLLRR